MRCDEDPSFERESLTEARELYFSEADIAEAIEDEAGFDRRS